MARLVGADRKATQQSLNSHLVTTEVCIKASLNPQHVILEIDKLQQKTHGCYSA